jgi:Werner syndrome ATP-dependent helicase
VIVISPLIALMQEQGEEMKRRGIPVCVFNSTNTTREKEEIKILLTNSSSEYRLIYMTPEYLIKSEDFVKNLAKINNLAMVCIDEAHAVSTWGLDFRPSYTKLNVIREWIPEIPILTLTATASTKVKNDIIKILELNNPLEITGNFDRPNLTIRVSPRGENVINDITALLEKYKNQYIIIYCKTRDETDKLAENINKYGIKCEAYHAGINDVLRTEIQKGFINGTYKCIIATIAFGMGINIPNVRLVIHYNCPKNMESYYQEIGRAGRDGLPSECCLFYSKKDFTMNRLFLKSIMDDDQRNYQENQIRLIEKYVYSTECRRKLLLVSFGQKVESCINCDNCLRTLNVLKDIDNAKTNIEEQESLKNTDYTKESYMLLNLLYKLNDKFGSGMLVNVLLGKETKIKDYMTEYDEFGLGEQVANEKWWKEYIRHLINNDYLLETQVKGSFGSTLSITNKGKLLRNKLNSKFPTFYDLENTEITNEEYLKNRVVLPTLLNIDKTVKKTRATKTKTTKTTKTKPIKTTKTTKAIKIDTSKIPTSYLSKKYSLDDLENDLNEIL